MLSFLLLEKVLDKAKKILYDKRHLGGIGMDNYSADIEKKKKRFIYNYRKDNYGEDRDRIKVDKYASLYLDKDYDQDYLPLIYIGDLWGRFSHKMRCLTGRTFDPGHYMFNGSFMYEYPIIKTKSNINTKNFADNLIKAIDTSGVGPVDIIAKGYGALVAACASESNLVNKVVAIHPAETPLASSIMLLDNLNKLEIRQRIIANIIARTIGDLYGFQKDKYGGLTKPEIFENIDLSKLIVVGSTLDRENETSRLTRDLYDIIYALTGEKSDGRYIYDENTLRKFGFTYFTEILSKSLKNAGSKENLLRYAHKYFDGWDFVETKEFDLNSIPEKDSMSLEDKKFRDKKVSSEGGSLTNKEIKFLEDKSSKKALSKGKKKKSTLVKVINVKDVSLEGKTPEFKKIFGNSEEKPNLLDKLFNKFVAENRSKFLDAFYYDGEEQTQEDGYRSFINEDFLEKEKDLGPEDDGLEFLSLADEPGGIDSKPDILDIFKKAEDRKSVV